MPSHSEEARERYVEEDCQKRITTPDSPPNRFLSRNLSQETGPTNSSGYNSAPSSSGSEGSVYPEGDDSEEEIEVIGKDSRLQKTSSLHRLLTFPLGLAQKLRLNLEALASVGFYWNKNSKMQCFKCNKVEESVVNWQGLKTKQVQLRHYDCVHPSEDDIPQTRASACNNYEAHRLYSFYQASWECTFVAPADLAKSGFYYTGMTDLCKCHFCGLEVKDWEQGDTADNEHMRWNANCPFLNGRPVGNFELGKEIKDTSSKSKYEIRPFAKAENDMSRPRMILPDVVPKNLGCSERPPMHSDMETIEARMATFTTWPSDLTQTPADLAEAGFFHTGKDDQVLCFHCDGGLKDWSPEDEPWVLHAKWFSSCRFLQGKMGKSFIHSVLKVHRPIMPLKDFKEALLETERAAREREAKSKNNAQRACKVN